MKYAAFLASGLLICLWTTGLQAEVGVPENGFPNWSERMIHVLVNRARCAPAEDLAGCTNCPDAACYSPQAPLVWNELLGRAARFHATNLTDSGCGMRHNSPCRLASDIGATYPDRCDGSVACACVSGVATCSDSNNSNTWDRLAAFGVSGGWRGENIASNADPLTVFYQWLWESANSDGCDATPENGHRYNILNGNFNRIGVGRDGNYTVQDFWSGSESQKIPSGAHYPQSGTPIAFRANWYDAQPPAQARVTIDGTSYAMTVERGTDGNATYLLEAAIPNECTRYYFDFIDSYGQAVTYPAAGAFGVNCAYDWTAARPDAGSLPPALQWLLISE